MKIKLRLLSAALQHCKVSLSLRFGYGRRGLRPSRCGRRDWFIARGCLRTLRVRLAPNLPSESCRFLRHIYPCGDCGGALPAYDRFTVLSRFLSCTATRFENCCQAIAIVIASSLAAAAFARAAVSRTDSPMYICLSLHLV